MSNHRIELEQVSVEAVKVNGHLTADSVVLLTEEGDRFEVRTYSLLDADIIALRGAVLSGGQKVRVVLEVDA